jgi:hypothetical protein
MSCFEQVNFQQISSHLGQQELEANESLGWFLERLYPASLHGIGQLELEALLLTAFSLVSTFKNITFIAWLVVKGKSQFCLIHVSVLSSGYK